MYRLCSGSGVWHQGGFNAVPVYPVACWLLLLLVRVQGKFKQAAAFDDLVTGQEFHRPFKNLPARWFVEKVLLALARKISPSMVVGPLTTPYLLSPYISAAQVGTVTTQSTLTAGDKDQDSGVHGDGDGADQAADWGSVAQIWLAPKA